MTALGRSVPPALGGASELVERAFLEPFFLLGRSISLFLSLPFSTLHRFSLKIRDRQYRAANDLWLNRGHVVQPPGLGLPETSYFSKPGHHLQCGNYPPCSTGPWF